MPKVKATKNEQGVYETKALNDAQFNLAFNKILKEKTSKRRDAKRTLRPGALSRRSVDDLARLGKKPDGQPFTVNDLKRMEKMRKQYKRRRGKQLGITYLEVVARAAEMDIRRANNQVKDGSGIVAARPAGAMKGDTGFYRVKASSRSRHQEHRVKVQFHEWDEAMANASGDVDSYQKAVKHACKGPVSFDCSCGRYQYWYRYLATIGNFQLSPPKELAFPKIRNQFLIGTACKHVLKVMTMLQSPAWQRPMARDMAYQADSVAFGGSKGGRYKFTNKDRKDAAKNRKLTTSQEAAKAEYQKYLRRQESLAKRLRQNPDETEALRSKLKKAKSTASKAKAKAKKLSAENQRLKAAAQDAMKLRLQSFVDGAKMMGSSKDAALKAFSKQNNIPVSTLRTLMKD